jgi:hypothetical protein
MSMPSLASVADLEAVVGDIASGADTTKAQARLDYASALVRAEAGVDWVNADGDELEDVPASISMVVVAMVERAWTNPNGAVQRAAGPFSESYGTAAADRIYLTKSDRKIIRAAAGALQIGTVAMTRGVLETPTVVYDNGVAFDLTSGVVV